MSKASPTPPRFLSRLFQQFCKNELHDELQGDLQEEFLYNVKELGQPKARQIYRKEVLKMLRPSIIKKFKRQNSHFNNMSMLRNYFITFIRNIKRNKSYTAINVFGLATGIACSTMLLLWIQDELSFENFHENKNELYRVIFEKDKSGNIAIDARGANAIGPALKDNYPEITDFTRFRHGITGWQVKYDEKTFSNDRLCVADPSFFEMFTFPMIKGDPKTALNDKYSVVITEKTAQKYFGNEDPYHKTIRIESADFTVSGIIKDPPDNSFIKFDLVFPIENMAYWWGDPLDSWVRDFRFYTFVKLGKESNWNTISEKIAASNIVRENNPESTTTKAFLQPTKDIHLYSNFGSDEEHGDINTVYIFSITALGILLIACFNFMNLSTARSSIRAKEIGLRKVIGARKKDVIKQFIVESVLLATIALALALLLAYLCLPIFNELSGKVLSLDIFNNPFLLIGLAITTVITGVVSGSYPALFLSSFQPSSVLKGSYTQKGNARFSLRKILVIVQFVFTSVLIFGSIAIYNQWNYLTSKDLGYQKDNLILMHPLGAFGDNFEGAKNELLQNPAIINVTKSTLPTGWYGLGSDLNPLDWEGNHDKREILMLRHGVDYSYLNTFEMKMAEGRFFSKEYATDSINFIINESAVIEMGIEDPIGKWFSYGNRRGMIIGVIADFHQTSLHEKILPLLLYTEPQNWNMAIKIGQHDLSETIAFLESKWEKFVPGSPFSFEFLDDRLSNFYGKEQKTRKVFSYFTVLAIIISVLGLFGLAAYTAEQRTKEIGIRKTLGASVINVVIMLSREFLKWTLLASTIALPIAYFAVNNWLDNFAYRINLGTSIFIMSIGIALIITLLTIIYQALKAASAKPVDTLRYE